MDPKKLHRSKAVHFSRTRSHTQTDLRHRPRTGVTRTETRRRSSLTFDPVPLGRRLSLSDFEMVLGPENDEKDENEAESSLPVRPAEPDLPDTDVTLRDTTQRAHDKAQLPSRLKRRFGISDRPPGLFNEETWDTTTELNATHTYGRLDNCEMVNPTQHKQDGVVGNIPEDPPSYASLYPQVINKSSTDTDGSSSCSTLSDWSDDGANPLSDDVFDDASSSTDEEHHLDPSETSASEYLMDPVITTRRDSFDDEICHSDESSTEIDGLGDGIRRRLSKTSSNKFTDMKKARRSWSFMGLHLKDIALQESLIKLVASEEAYMDKLGTLMSHYHHSWELPSVMEGPADIAHDVLFSHAASILTTTQEMLSEFKHLWESNVILDCRICDIVTMFASSNMWCYMAYSENYRRQMACYAAKMKSRQFRRIISQVEKKLNRNELNFLNLLSEPIRRLAAYGPLLAKILERTVPYTDNYYKTSAACSGIKAIIVNCARSIEFQQQLEKVQNIVAKLDYTDSRMNFVFIEPSHSIVKTGSVTHIDQDGMKGHLYLILFDDMLFITRKNKRLDRYSVIDYGLRAMAILKDQCRMNLPESPDDCSFEVKLLESFVPKVTYTLQCEDSTDTQEWRKLLCHTYLDKDGNAIASEWYLQSSLRQRVGVANKLQWNQMPEVISRNLQKNMTKVELYYQEALFELLTSEAIYINRLDLLISVLYEAEENMDDCKGATLFSSLERSQVFSNLVEIRNVAVEFFAELEAEWRRSPVLTCGLCTIMRIYAEERFECYVKYTSERDAQEHELRKQLKKAKIRAAVGRLETDPRLMKMGLVQLLTEPVQRVTRYTIMMEAVIKYQNQVHHDEYYDVLMATNATRKLSVRCNTLRGIRQKQAEVNSIAKKMLFPPGLKAFSFLDPRRTLVKKGLVTTVQVQGTFSCVQLFLFDDMLFVTKPESQNRYEVLDYSKRMLAEVRIFYERPKWLASHFSDHRRAWSVCFLKTFVVHNFISCDGKETDEWHETLCPEELCEDRCLRFKSWFTKRVKLKGDYSGTENPDVLFMKGDVIDVQKMTYDRDYYYGSRQHDGLQGWLPSGFCEDVDEAAAEKLRAGYRKFSIAEEQLLSSINHRVSNTL